MVNRVHRLIQETVVHLRLCSPIHADDVETDLLVYQA
jgi:hypothetical protein